jgi:hypothetical protein
LGHGGAHGFSYGFSSGFGSPDFRLKIGFFGLLQIFLPRFHLLLGK